MKRWIFFFFWSNTQIYWHYSVKLRVHFFFVNSSKFGRQFLCAQNQLPISFSSWVAVMLFIYYIFSFTYYIFSFTYYIFSFTYFIFSFTYYIFSFTYYIFSFTAFVISIEICIFLIEENYKNISSYR